MNKNKIFTILIRLIATYFVCVTIYLWLNFNGPVGDKIYFLISIILVLLAFFPDKTYKILQKIWRVITNKE